jgi:hypothetical protein
MLWCTSIKLCGRVGNTSTSYSGPGFKYRPGDLSESELLYNWRSTTNQFILATSPLRLMTSNFILQMNTWGHCPYVTSFLMRGWVCHLQFLLVLACTVILRSESCGTHDHILLSQIWDSPNLEGQVPVFTSPRNRVARLYPEALDSLFVASYNSQGCGGDGGADLLSWQVLYMILLSLSR